jgi:hypothetical protein
MNISNDDVPAFTGGCQCGEIRYEIHGQPAVALHCQCRQCQYASGEGHGSHLTFFGADVRLTGAAREWEMRGERGNRKRRGFCGSCGAPVFLTSPDNPALFAVPPASLDEPERFAPSILVWTKGAFSWDHMDPSLERFEKLPPGV